MFLTAYITVAAGQLVEGHFSLFTKILDTFLFNGMKIQFFFFFQIRLRRCSKLESE